jgi:diguanylate cyclase (GGDEF)-like protein
MKPEQIEVATTWTTSAAKEPPGLAAECAALLAALGDDVDPAALRRTLSVLEARARALEVRLADQSARVAYLESLSVTDELTGLLNRRGFDRELERTLARAARTGETGLLLLCDVDRFKPINDTYGHQIGDTVLFSIAQLLRRGARASDAAARLGGDEFAVILTNAAPSAAQPRIARMRELLDRLVVESGELALTVRVSFGHAPYGPGSDAASLIRAADRALYRAKAGPRVVRAGPLR